MSKYTIQITGGAKRELRRLDRQIELRVRGVIMRLADDPFPPASTQMVGRQGEFRLRTGDYRIIYRVEHDQLQILVIKVAHRRGVYRG